MRLFSWNVNGIRAAARKGFLDWFAAHNPDVVSLQELKAKPEQLDEALKSPSGYHAAWCCAQKPGYSGVAVFTRQKPDLVAVGCGVPEYDAEGRVLRVDLGDLTVVNIYFPHSRRDLSRLDFKMAFCEYILDWLKKLKAERPNLVVCGDYNTAHQDLDLTHYKTNRKNAGFLPVEREWMDRFLAHGFHDVFRERHPDEAGHHTWWSNRKGVREKNVGWRIDYHCVADTLLDRVVDVGHQQEVRGSDHCPVYLELAD